MKIIKNNISWIILGFFAIMFFTLNIYTNIRSDDFSYKFIFNKESYFIRDRLLFFHDIFTSMYAHYFMMNGRLQIQSWVQIFLLSDNKLYFNIANTIVMCFLVIVIYLHSNKSLKRIRPTDFLFIIIGLWFLIPNPDTTLLFLTGSINYLWPTTLVLFYLLVYKKISMSKRKTSKYLLPFLFIFGFLSGYTHEVLAIGISGALFFSNIKKIKRLKPEILYLISSFMLGSLLLIIAPSNFNRLKTSNEETSNILNELIHRGAIIILPKYYIGFIFLFLVMIIIKFKSPNFFILFIREQKIFFLSIFFSFLFIIMAGQYSPRVFFGIEVFSILLLYLLFLKIDKKPSFNFIHFSLISLSIFMIFEWSQVYFDLKYNYMNFKNAEKSWIKTTGSVFPLMDKKVKNRFVSTGLGSIDKNHWVNKSMSLYYNKDSMCFIPKHIYSELNNDNFSDFEQFDINRIDQKGELTRFDKKLYFDLKSNYFIWPVNNKEKFIDNAKLIFLPKKSFVKTKFSLKEELLYDILKKEPPVIEKENSIYYLIDFGDKYYLIFRKPKLIRIKNLQSIEFYDTNKSLLVSIQI